MKTDTTISQTTPAVALSIAGSDSSGGAGVQADLKTFAAHDVYGASVITAVTAQNTVGVHAAEVLSPELIVAQIDAVCRDLPLAAAKTGMLATVEVIEAVADAIHGHALRPLVVDPVMIARSGDALIDDNAVAAVARRMLPLADLATPNRHEAARLLEMTRLPDDPDEAARAAEAICRRFGCKACIVKGALRDALIVDVLWSGEGVREFAAQWIQSNRTHGSGCAFSAAITANLARGLSLADAVAGARRFISAAIAQAPAIGRGNPAVWPGAVWR